MFDVDNCLLVLAQGGDAPPLPTEGPTGETTGQDGSPAGGDTGGGAGAGGGGAGGPGGSGIWLLIFGAILAMILFSMFGQRKEKKKRQELLSSIKKHDKVQTIGGVVGSIVEVKNDQVVLKVDETSNTRITFSRSAIQQVLDSSTTGGAEVKTEPLEP